MSERTTPGAVRPPKLQKKSGVPANPPPHHGDNRPSGGQNSLRRYQAHEGLKEVLGVLGRAEACASGNIGAGR